MAKMKFQDEKRKRSKQVVKGIEHRHQQRTKLTTDELLEVSQILSEYARSGKVKATSQSPNVNRVVRRAILPKSPSGVQPTLNRVNRSIVARNEKENKPTEAVKRIYRAILEE